MNTPYLIFYIYIYIKKNPNKQKKQNNLNTFLNNLFWCLKNKNTTPNLQHLEKEKQNAQSVQQTEVLLEYNCWVFNAMSMSLHLNFD